MAVQRNLDRNYRALIRNVKGTSCVNCGSTESHNYETGDVEFKAKVDGRKVLEIKANDFVPYITD